jgi:peptidoglycan hydrolase CwlO-like protein
MATVYSSRTCLPKFLCSILVVGLFTAGVLITGAYPHKDLSDQVLQLDNRTTSSTSKHDSYQDQNKTDSSAQLEEIQASNKALQAHLEHALAKIEHNVQKNKELTEQISRSPRAIKTIQALEAAIAILG